MDGNSYKKFQSDIKYCSDKRLKEVYWSVVDEMDRRSWHKKQVEDVVEAISEIESDWGMA